MKTKPNWTKSEQQLAEGLEQGCRAFRDTYTKKCVGYTDKGEPMFEEISQEELELRYKITLAHALKMKGLI